MSQYHISQLLLRATGWISLGVSSTLWSHETILPQSDHNGVKIDEALQLTVNWMNSIHEDIMFEATTTFGEYVIQYVMTIYKNATNGQYPFALTHEQLRNTLGVATFLYVQYRSEAIQNKLFSPAYHEQITKTPILPPKNVHINVGDITKVPSGLIIHGVNCSGAMGSGVALALLRKYPIVREQFMSIYNTDRPTLGHVDYVNIDQVLTIGNCYTQQTCGSDGKRYADLQAVKTCLIKAFDYCVTNEFTLHTPRIASDLGGLSWTYEVFPIICEMATQYPTVDVMIHILPQDYYKL